MRPFATRRETIELFLAAMPVAPLLSACSLVDSAYAPTQSPESDTGPNTSQYVIAIEDEPDTVDFMCTSIHYTVAINVFNRLVETVVDEQDNRRIEPSLAESWEVADDGRAYTFHLRKGVTFSNGSPLTSSDVLYTFVRLLTHPDSCNRDIAEPILGASKLASGEASDLEGFTVLDDQSFVIELEQPFEAFLPCLSMPGASIVNAHTMEQVGDRFGIDPKSTIGTGPFVFAEWEPNKRLLLSANKDCWEGPPHSEGLDLRFLEEPEEVRRMFEQGELDILDLDEVGSASEYFVHGDIYQDRQYVVSRIGTTYIALNHTVQPLDDVRVRKALQRALDRTLLLDAVYSGFGTVEHGIYPHGLYGFNPDLPQIPYAPDEARSLLAEAGHADGFDLLISVKSSSTQWEMTLVKLVASMWADVGVRATIAVLEEDDFMAQRKSGQLACYSAMWTADYDDPDTFLYTFFGNQQNTTFRSLCYQREDIMERVRHARTITNADERLKEYQDLEQIIVQDDAAWIPLFSRKRIYVTSERTHGIASSWNGSIKTRYCEISIDEPPQKGAQ